MDDTLIGIEKEYIMFADNKRSLFYEPKKQELKGYTDFKLIGYDLKEWLTYIDDDWVYMIYNPQKMPEQGWKIHITAHIKDAELCLYAISDQLIKNKISFKYVPTIESLRDKNSKYGDRSSSGKFITIYPNTEKEFIALLKKLKPIVDKFEKGPYILNDQQWKQSNVFFRYGAFKKMTAIINGKEVDAIKTPSGEYLEDKRVPYYYLPDFIKEPKYIVDNNTFPSKNEFTKLKEFNIISALHFSNAGGVYLAKDKNGNKVVLKEGRQKAGLDSKGNDGFFRNKKEYITLKKVNKSNETVKVLDYFKAWEHNYIVEEFVDGQTLDEFIPEQFPFMSQDEKEINEYAKKSMLLMNKLVRAIKKVHRLGIAIGDLKPNNIMITKDFKNIKLIDLENADSPHAKYRPSLQTLGFVSSNARTFEEADWFALYRICRYVFLPVEQVLDLTPQLMYVHDDIIERKFGRKVSKFLNEIRIDVARHAWIMPKSLFMEKKLYIPKHELNFNSLEYIKNQLKNGIINNLDYSTTSLTKGDISQYSNRVSKYNFGNGAFGVVYALMNDENFFDSNVQMPTGLKEWLVTSSAIVNEINLEATNIGEYSLFTGLAGIASVLNETPYTQSVSNNILEKMKLLIKSGDISEVDISLYKGLTGIGLQLLSVYLKNKDSDVKESLEKIAKEIIRRFRADNKKNDKGFLTGWSGVALFLLKLGEVDKNWQNDAVEVMDYVITSLTTDDFKVIDSSRGFNRIVPYIENGSSGIAIVMTEFYRSDHNFFNEFRKRVFDSLLDSGMSYCTYNGGLLSGYTGFLPLANALNTIDYSNEKILKNILEKLNIFLVSNYNDEILLPGNYGFKCSMDVESGAAGLLLALSDIEKKKWWSWMPLINDEIFRG